MGFRRRKIGSGLKGIGWLVLVSISTLPMSAQVRQHTTEIFAGVTTNHYGGDLSPDINVNAGLVGGHLGMKYAWTPYFTLGFNIAGGSLQGSDASNSNPSMQRRNLSFKTDFFEVSALADLHFFPFAIGNLNKVVTPYLYGGVGYMFYNPTAEYQGKTYDLRDLNTEGQGTGAGAKSPYGIGSLVLPMGGGFKFDLGKRFFISAHTGVRFTFTDYIDDVSGSYPDLDKLESSRGSIARALSDRSIETGAGAIATTGAMRGNPGNFDRYFISGLTLSYIIGQPSCPTFRRNFLGLF